MLEIIEAIRLPNGILDRPTSGEDLSEHGIAWDDTAAVSAVGTFDPIREESRTPRRWTVLRVAKAGPGTTVRIEDGPVWEYGGSPANHVVSPGRSVAVRLRGPCDLKLISLSATLMEPLPCPDPDDGSAPHDGIGLESRTVSTFLDMIPTRCGSGPIAAVSWLRAIAPIVADAVSTSDRDPRPAVPFARMQLPDWRMKRLDSLIDNALHEKLTLRSLAHSCGLSAFHFSRIFRHTVGVSPMRYVQQRRCERARRLIEEGSLSLAEIANSCGFAHQAHFTTVFKKVEGTTPGQLRRSGGDRRPDPRRSGPTARPPRSGTPAAIGVRSGPPGAGRGPDAFQPSPGT